MELSCSLTSDIETGHKRVGCTAARKALNARSSRTTQSMHVYTYTQTVLQHPESHSEHQRGNICPHIEIVHRQTRIRLAGMMF